MQCIQIQDNNIRVALQNRDQQVKRQRSDPESIGWMELKKTQRKQKIMIDQNMYWKQKQMEDIYVYSQIVE